MSSFSIARNAQTTEQVATQPATARADAWAGRAGRWRQGHGGGGGRGGGRCNLKANRIPDLGVSALSVQNFGSRP
jgi:hypothetical protein